MNKKENKSFTLIDIDVEPGTKKDIHVKVGDMYTASPLYVPVTVFNGKWCGPVLYVCAAIHGDELNGIEAIRLLKDLINPKKLAGTVQLVAIANPLSFVMHKRNLPDGRDLNRQFPGSPRGTMGSQMAHAFFSKVVARSHYGIDLHTAGRMRTNYPHIRGDLAIPEIRWMAKAFGTQVIFDQEGLKKSLRTTACERGIPTIVYEAGETMKFQKGCIEKGKTGVLNILKALQMIPGVPHKEKHQIIVRDDYWVRSGSGGILQMFVRPGEIVEKDQKIARVSKPFGTRESIVLAPHRGLVIGTATFPMVYPGTSICHLYTLRSDQVTKVRKWTHTKWLDD